MNKLILDTLKPVAVPVSFQTYNGQEDTYITFFFFGENSAQAADDEETATHHFIQLDIWSKGDYTNLVGQVKACMKKAGFGRLMAMDLYEKDTQIYHKAIRYNYKHINQEG